MSGNSLNPRRLITNSYFFIQILKINRLKPLYRIYFILLLGTACLSRFHTDTRLELLGLKDFQKP